jgi:hypothetical protein
VDHLLNYKFLAEITLHGVLLVTSNYTWPDLQKRCNPQGDFLVTPLRYV